MAQERARADRLLVDRGFFESRAAAQAAIAAGGVSAEGQPVVKASQMLDVDADITARPAHPYVSRGGVKLAHALNEFSVSPEGRLCLDIGASTGGFTDVLLRRGARKIYAVDVGRGQLHRRIAEEDRVVALEDVDARALTRRLIPESPSLIVCDVSFIALEKLLASPLTLASDGADLIALFKPQFQVGRAHVGKGGIVSNADAVDTARAGLSNWLTEAGWPPRAWTASPIPGGDGNQEHLVHARRVKAEQT